MCTVSWMLTSTGHELFANRDERVLRAPARGPRCERSEYGRFLAPRDGEAGGTWIAVNEHGLSLCLLNRWVESEEQPDRTWRSRGLLLWELADSPSRDVALARLETASLADTQPFTLLVLAGGGQPLVRAWDGRVLSAPAPVPVAESRAAESHTGLLASGGADPAAVAAARTRAFREREALRAGAETEHARDAAGDARSAVHHEFHSAHDPSGAAPCRHDVEVRTVSFSHTRVDAERVEFRYAPGPPCTTRLGAPVVLARRGASA